ncbi:peptidase inhibitor family I36 protein [Actinoplanes missouriensis]|uniref:peptidase inhibitor family I36 protein n=1 Tax=Actinoplanes missouriensis TaxID=1866 RepID=UPI003411D603
MRLRGLLAVAAGIAATISLAPAGAAQAADSYDGTATFKNGTINLQEDGWGAAQTCVVHSATTVRCYATGAEADAALGYNRATDPLVKKARSAGMSATAAAAATPACANGWLCLYEHENGGGRRLIFQDEYWQKLSEYAFDNQMTSWRNNQGSGDTGGIFDEKSGGFGQRTLSASTYNSNVGSTLNDKADQVYG